MTRTAYFTHIKRMFLLGACFLAVYIIIYRRIGSIKTSRSI